MLTNLSKEQAVVSQLTAICRARLPWKSSSVYGSKHSIAKATNITCRALELAGMIAHQLGMRIAQRIVSTVSCERLSYEKL
jgi:hypothetical protein